MSSRGPAGGHEGRLTRAVLAGLIGVCVLGLLGAGGFSAHFPASSLAASPVELHVASSPSEHFPDGPPARLTGGFGEDSCFACHWNGEENEGGRALEISGFPEVYEPGQRYRIRVELSHPDLVVGGFQLAIRHAADTSQAGRLDVPADESRRVTLLEERGITFAQHLLAGIQPTAPEGIRWDVKWTAPASGERVLLHVSSVAGDGDESQIGDHVFTRALESSAAPSP